MTDVKVDVSELTEGVGSNVVEEEKKLSDKMGVEQAIDFLYDHLKALADIMVNEEPFTVEDCKGHVRYRVLGQNQAKAQEIENRMNALIGEGYRFEGAVGDNVIMQKWEEDN